MNLLIYVLFEVLIENIIQFHESIEESFENFIKTLYTTFLHCSKNSLFLFEESNY